MKISKFLSVIVFFPYIAVFSMSQEGVDFNCNNQNHSQENFKVVEEGFWASHEDPGRDTYEGHYPWPEENPKQWKNQDIFLKKLTEIEKELKLLPQEVNHPRGGVIHYRGWATSRLNPGEIVGSKEFEYKNSKTGEVFRWPEGFDSHYVKEYNVKPSAKFYYFVMNCRLKKDND